NVGWLRQPSAGRHHDLVELADLGLLGHIACLVKAHQHSLEALEIRHAAYRRGNRQRHVDWKKRCGYPAVLDGGTINLGLTLEFGGHSRDLYDLTHTNAVRIVVFEHENAFGRCWIGVV